MLDAERRRRVPTAPTPLIGRRREITQLRRLLSATRLMTLTGTAGAGKTRLALELAGLAVEDGATAVFVDLAVVRDSDQVLPAIARALGLRDNGGRPPAAMLYHELVDEQLLMVLDNVEHVLDAVPHIVAMLRDCPGLRVVATSRAALQAPGEQQFTVDPLPIPALVPLPSPPELANIDSVTLFLDRVRASAAPLVLNAETARTVAEICSALDGLPLALELAAAQVRSYGIDEVLARTRSRLRLLTAPRRAVAPRHRSLANALAWSVELLDEPSEQLFRRLSVFTDGWTADGAQSVCSETGADIMPELDELVEQSLVMSIPNGHGVRYRMLGTVREYASSLLDDAGERDAQNHRLLCWCRELATEIGGGVLGAGDATTLDRAENELENISVALDAAARTDTGLAISTAAQLYRLWDSRGYLARGRAHLEGLLVRPNDGRDRAERAAGWERLGLLLIWQDDHSRAQDALTRCADIAESVGDTDRLASALASVVISQFVTDAVDDTDTAASRAVALARTTGTTAPLSRALCALGLQLWAQGRRPDAIDALREALEVARAGGGLWGTGKLSYFIGWCAFLDGDHSSARRYLNASAATFRRLTDVRSLPDSLDALGCLDTTGHHYERALMLFTAADRLRLRAGSRRHAYLRRQCENAEQKTHSALGPTQSSATINRVDKLTLDQIAREAFDETAPRRLADLTPRETSVADLVVDGLSNRAIARRLNISERTVDRHLENIRGKLDVQTRAQIAAWAAVRSRPGATQTD